MLAGLGLCSWRRSGPVQPSTLAVGPSCSPSSSPPQGSTVRPLCLHRLASDGPGRCLSCSCVKRSKWPLCAAGQRTPAGGSSSSSPLSTSPAAEASTASASFQSAAGSSFQSAAGSSFQSAAGYDENTAVRQQCPPSALLAAVPFVLSIATVCVTAARTAVSSSSLRQ